MIECGVVVLVKMEHNITVAASGRNVNDVIMDAVQKIQNDPAHYFRLDKPSHISVEVMNFESLEMLSDDDDDIKVIYEHGFDSGIDHAKRLLDLDVTDKDSDRYFKDYMKERRNM